MDQATKITATPDFEKMGGLLPVVVQDVDNDEVLMQAFMNVDAWRSTLETGKVHYWSRKKKRLWMKGEQSGHYQHVRDVLLDNDFDCALLKVEQVGGAVEDGYRSCFFWARSGDAWVNVGQRVFEPKEVYEAFTEDLVLAVPSGSLGEVCRALLEAAGYPALEKDTRGEVFDIEDESKLRGLVAPAQEIPALLARGEADVGLTGSDMVEDSGENLTDVADLAFNKHGLGRVHWVLAVPDDGRYLLPEDYEGSTIVTQIPTLVGGKFSDRGVGVWALLDEGDTTRVAEASSPIIVEISETGESLAERGYRPTHTICTSTVHLFAHNESMGYGWKRRRVATLVERLEEAATRLPENPKRISPVEPLP